MKRFTHMLILLISSGTIASADGCWDALELAKYGQKSLDDVAVFSFKDAINCQPLKDVKLNFLGKEFISDGNGTITMPQPPEEIDAFVPMSISKEEYIPVKKNMHVSLGNYWQTLFLLTKEIPLDSARFILSWGKDPADLDLHLKSDDFHISYRKTRSIPNKVKLDRDARKGYGPETITLDKLRADKEYTLLVHRYSTTGKINNKAKVSVYLNNSFDKTLFMKETNAKCVQIATIKDKKITYKIEEVKERECQ